MPALGIPELLIIAAILLVLFGIGKLGQIGGAVGQSIREFRESVKEVTHEDED